MSSELRAQLQTTLGNAYRLEREIGGGGMSRVFVAADTVLGRSVVVKVLPPEMASSVSIDRFKREISLAARLQHPHIVPLLSAGETGGLPYFTMPFVEGESLRARLTRGGEMSVRDAVHLLREIASALAYAHRKGVIHRDIKPENVLVTEQHAMVTDFGVAKAIRAAASVAELPGTLPPALTEIGLALGTPAYMAPEQVAGDPGTDHRADIYAFGVVAYEMLTARTPFGGRAPQAVMAAHVVEAPESISGRRPGIPAALAALIMRCLEKRPEDRPQSSDEVLRALDDVPASRVGEKEVRPSVAVLPMVNTSGDPENEHFSDGLTDELIGALSQVSDLTVSGRTSVFALKGKGLSVRAIAETLHVAHLLEGSVRRAGNRLKVRVQLVDANGSVLWSEAFDRLLEDVFAVQEEIAQAVVRSLEVHLGTSAPLVRPATADLTAYDLYLKGRFIRRRMGPEDMRLAITLFEQAVARDPTYARAYAWLSDSHYLLVVLASAPAAAEVPRARAYATRALALDTLVAEGHWALGQILVGYDFEWLRAGREFTRAIELDASSVEALNLNAIRLLNQRRFEEAERSLTRGLAVDPLVPEVWQTLGRVYLYTGQTDRAIVHFRESLALAPAFSYARGNLGHAYFQKGMPSDAVSEFEKAAATGSPGDAAQLAYAYAVTGRRDDALAIIDRLLSAEREGLHAPAYHLGLAYVGLGETSSAFQWLERAYDERDPHIGSLNTLPAFEPLRTDPRFATLVRRMGLTPRGAPSAAR